MGQTRGMYYRRLQLLALLVLGLLMIAPIASAQTTVSGSVLDRAADAMAQDPVYVDPEAQSTLSQSEAADLRERIARSSAGPIYVAVLPEQARREAGGSIDEVIQRLGNTLQRRGTYIVVIGSELRAGSTMFPAGTVPRLADEAIRANRGQGAAAVVGQLVDSLGDAARGGGTDTGSGGGDSGGSGWFLPALLVVGGGAGGYAFFRRRKAQREEERKQLEEVREVAMDDLVALGDDLRALDLEVEMPNADPKAKEDYVRALDSYELATRDLDRAQRPQDLHQVTSALEEGRFAMANAKARLAGRALPEHRPPCFFDPRHGPSVKDVEWSPDGGAPRQVPACSADAERIARGGEPMTREITVRGRRMPYWNAPPYYGPWAGGYFGGFGLLEGFLIGSLLSGGFGGEGWYGGGSGGDSSGGDDGFGGGGFGGGDFGGGFGGGDFGGGDFG